MDEDEDVFLGRELDGDALFVQLECGHMFEVNDFDNHIRLSTDFRQTNINPPSCPRCKRIIRYFDGVKRYKGHLNKARKVIQAAKIRVVDMTKELQQQLGSAEVKLKKLTEACTKRQRFFENVPSLVEAIKQTEKLRARIKKISNLQLTASLCQKVFLLDLIFNVTANIDRPPHATSDGHSGNAIMNEGIKQLATSTSNASKNEMNQLVLDTLVEVIESRDDPYGRHFDSVSSYKNKTSPTDDDLLRIARILVDSRPYGLTDDENRSIMTVLTNLEPMERIEKAGAFRECVCGYIYVIGNCGGAMEIATCPECGHAIGGQEHRDVDGVRHTGVIDGSTQSAYPQ